MIVVDRIEADRAVLVMAGEAISVPLSALPEGTNEGAVLALSRLPSEEAGRRARAEARLRRLQAQDSLPDEIEL